MSDLLLLQTTPPSNTWFTNSPEWGWHIVVYFFLGGIAGGPRSSPVCSISSATASTGA